MEKSFVVTFVYPDGDNASYLRSTVEECWDVIRSTFGSMMDSTRRDVYFRNRKTAILFDQASEEVQVTASISCLYSD